MPRVTNASRRIGFARAMIDVENIGTSVGVLASFFGLLGMPTKSE
jgi:hypothetical protein